MADTEAEFKKIHAYRLYLWLTTYWMGVTGGLCSMVAPKRLKHSLLLYNRLFTVFIIISSAVNNWFVYLDGNEHCRIRRTLDIPL